MRGQQEIPRLLRFGVWLGVLVALSACGLFDVSPVDVGEGQGEPLIPSGTRGIADDFAFEQTLYPWLVKSCNGCHSSSGDRSSNPFAASDLTMAHSAIVGNPGNNIDFLNPANSALVTKVKGGHNCPGSRCDEAADEMARYIQEWWVLTENNPENTIGETPSEETSEVVLTPGVKTGEVLILENIPNSVDDPNQFATLTFALDEQGYPGAVLSIDVQLFGEDAYRFRALTLTSANSNIHVRDIRITFNQSFNAANSDFRSIDYIVGAGTTVLLYPSSSIVSLVNGPGQDRLSFEFGGIAQTANQQACRALSAFQNEALPVLQNDCAGCHGAGGAAQGFFDIASNDPAIVCSNALFFSQVFDPQQSLLVRNPDAQGNPNHPAVGGFGNNDRQNVVDWLNAEAPVTLSAP